MSATKRGDLLHDALHGPRSGRREAWEQLDQARRAPDTNKAAERERAIAKAVAPPEDEAQQGSAGHRGIAKGAEVWDWLHGSGRRSTGVGKIPE